MKNKYNVDEQVILVSITHPEFDGEYIIEEVIMPDQEHDFIDDDDELPRACVVYKLAYLDEIFPWECELRKKYQPSTDSFKTIMNKFKLGETI